MADKSPPTRTRMTSTTTGSGAFQLDAAWPGFDDFETGLGVGNSCCCMAIMETDEGVFWEEFKGSLTAAETLERTIVYKNSSGIQPSKLPFPGGTKHVFASLPGGKVPLVDVEQVWAAFQWYRQGFGFGPGDNAYWFGGAADGAHFARLYANNNLVAEHLSTGSHALQSYAGGAVAGPIVRLVRAKSTTPADKDLLAKILWQGQDAGANMRNLIELQGRIDSASSGNAIAELDINLANLGDLDVIARFRGDRLSVPNKPFLVGKEEKDSLSTQGTEVKASGQVVTTTSGVPCLIINRIDGANNTLIDVRVNGVNKSKVNCGSDGNTVTWGNFVGGHPARFRDGERPKDLPVGTLLSALDDPYDDAAAHLSKVEVTSQAGCRRVLGAFSAWLQPAPNPDTGEVGWEPPYQPGDCMVDGLGALFGVRTIGPVTNGDLLMASDVPGCAMAQGDDVIRAHTIGKAKRTNLAEGEKLIPWTAYTG